MFATTTWPSRTSTSCTSARSRARSGLRASRRADIEDHALLDLHRLAALHHGSGGLVAVTAAVDDRERDVRAGRQPRERHDLLERQLLLRQGGAAPVDDDG